MPRPIPHWVGICPNGSAAGSEHLNILFGLESFLLSSHFLHSFSHKFWWNPLAQSIPSWFGPQFGLTPYFFVLKFSIYELFAHLSPSIFHTLWWNPLTQGQTHWPDPWTCDKILTNDLWFFQHMCRKSVTLSQGIVHGVWQSQCQPSLPSLPSTLHQCHNTLFRTCFAHCVPQWAYIFHCFPSFPVNILR